MKYSKHLFLFGLLLWAGALHAQEVEAPCVVVEENNGQFTEFLLNTEPRIAFDGEELTLTTSEVTVVLRAEDVARTYVKKTGSAQGIAGATKTAARVALSSDGLTLSGLEPGSAVDVYSADGRQLKAAKAAADGTASLPLNANRTGLLIVKTNNQSFKLIRK